MTLPEELLELMRSTDPTGKAQFPPEVAKYIPSEFIEYKKGESLKLRFKIKKEFNNPFNITFGGVYGMFFDAVFGPFSGLEAQKPTTSLDMNITFLKSLSVADEYVDITAKVISKSKTFLILQGEAHNSKGDLVATCNSRMMVVDMSRMSRTKPS